MNTKVLGVHVKNDDYCPFVAEACARDIVSSLASHSNVQLRVDNIVLVVDSSEWKFVLDIVLKGIIARNEPLELLLVATKALWLLDPHEEFPQQEIFDACCDSEDGHARINEVIASMQKKIYDF